MRIPRVFKVATFMIALVGPSAHGLAAVEVEAHIGDASGDQAILQQAANAMVFQMVFADMAMALTTDASISKLARHIYDLSHRGLRSIKDMAQACDLLVEGHLDAAAWRRVGAMREISRPALRDQVYLDAQLMRLYEAQDESLLATFRAKHDIVKNFVTRSGPEIESLMHEVREVVRNLPTPDHA